MCTGGQLGAYQLTGGGSCLLVCCATGDNGGDDSGLVGSITGHMNITFLAYLAPEVA